MNAQEKQELLALLAANHQAYLESVGGVSEEDARRATEPGCWTILEIAEHLIIVETNLLARVAGAVSAAERAEVRIDPRREGLIKARAADRSRKVQSPEAAIPAGRFQTLAAAVEKFAETRRATVQFIEAYDHEPRGRIADHPVIGPANCYEMLLMLASHPKRHAGQIQEIRGCIRTGPSSIINTGA